MVAAVVEVVVVEVVAVVLVMVVVVGVVEVAAVVGFLFPFQTFLALRRHGSATVQLLLLATLVEHRTNRAPKLTAMSRVQWRTTGQLLRLMVIPTGYQVPLMDIWAALDRLRDLGGPLYWER